MLSTQICGAGGPRHRLCREKLKSALHISLEPLEPRDELRSIDHQLPTLGRRQGARKYLGQRLTFEIDIRTSVTHRRVEACVPESLADRCEVDTGLEKRNSGAVPQGMRMEMFIAKRRRFTARRGNILA